MREIKEGLTNTENLSIMGYVAGIVVIGVIIGNAISFYSSEYAKTDYSTVDMDGGNITFQLELKTSVTFDTWDFKYLLLTNNSYELNVTNEWTFRGYLYPTTGWHLIEKIQDGGKLDLTVWIRNLNTDNTEMVRLMHHDTKLK